MKDNKPLIFINSAQSNNFKDHNQYVFDSRYHKPLKKIEVIKKVQDEIKVISKEEEKSQEIDNKEASQQQEDINNVGDDGRIRKLMNKMELLNKRASLGRYVYVSVDVNDKVLEGYFMKLNNSSVILNIDDEEIEISINDINNITIIKV